MVVGSKLNNGPFLVVWEQNNSPPESSIPNGSHCAMGGATVRRGGAARRRDQWERGRHVTSCGRRCRDQWERGRCVSSCGRRNPPVGWRSSARRKWEGRTYREE